MANTSAATVSYILNNTKRRYVSDELRTRVLDAAKALHYNKSVIASSLKGKRRKIIALLIPQFSNIFFNRIAMGVETAARERGYLVLICNTHDDPEIERLTVEKIIAERVDGLLISPSVQGYNNIEFLRHLNLPYVSVERPIENIDDYDLVACDNYQLGYQATEHLIQYGHKKIAYIDWLSRVSNLQDRRTGYRECLAHYGLPYDPDIVRDGSFSAESGYEITRTLWEENRGVTAIIYAVNVPASGGIAYLHDAHLKVPKDVSIVIIGTPEWTKLHYPPLTCMDQNENEIGKMATEILIDKIEKTTLKTLPRFVKMKIPVQMIPGRSVRKILHSAHENQGIGLKKPVKTNSTDIQT